MVTRSAIGRPLSPIAGVPSRPRRSFATRGLALALLALFPRIAPARAQGPGDYMNVESPQVSPITVTTVGTRRVLLVCNTPDNSLEVWDTDESIVPAGARLNDRLRVGLEPVSVHAVGDRFWTANFLGDSVTTGRLEIVGTQVKARLLATAEVGDEPMDIAFYDHGGTGTVFVTLNTTSALAWLDGDTLAPHDPAFPVHQLIQSSGSPPHGLKEPHAVRVQGGRVFALAFKGGVTHMYSNHDLDVLSAALPGTPGVPLAFDRQVVLPSTTNSSMRFATDGSLWVVGGEALNMTVETKPQARLEPSGFVQSTLYRITGAGTGSPSLQRRDINRVCGTPVDGTPDLPLAMPTDLALFEVGGVVTKVFVAAFSSDRIGVFSKPVVCSEWSRRTLGYGTGPVGGGPRWGPRGLALGANQAGLARLYVMNRLDNSISIFDPVSETVIESVAMHDPTPPYIREGREFLYSADQSGNGFVSCASCHTDGRTDGLSWKLGNPAGTGPVEVPPLLVDVFRLMGTGIRNPDPDFNMAMLFPPDGTPPATEPPRFDPIIDPFDPLDTDDKREMVTQSLQGLSNFEVAFTDPIGSRGSGEQSGLVRTLFHNAPFHWRGDKKSLGDFNEAFVTLLGGPDVDGIDPPDGLTAEEMDRFEGFIHSITYPPNPKQPRNRKFSDDGTDFDGETGLTLFHTEDVLKGRSCVHCHALPEGSNNRLTIFETADMLPGYVGLQNRQPTESSAMRGLFQKEPLLEVDGNFPVDPALSPIVGHFGLNHNGTIDREGTVLTSLNTFINAFFDDPALPEARAVKQFAHEFDWGVAPAIGQVVFVPQTAGIPTLDNLEGEANAANASLVAWGEFPGQVPERRGWRYYPVNGTYLEEPGFASFTLAQLHALLTMPGDSLTFLSVPLGSERRVAAPSGVAGNYVQRTPANVVLEPMVTNTAYVEVPDQRDNWVPPDAPDSIKAGITRFFVFMEPGTGPVGGEPRMDEVFAKAMRLFQYGLLDGENTMNYGVSNLRHEAPRRLRVRGDDIVTGAKLLLSVPWPVLPYSGPPPSDPAAQATFPTLTLELPIYPTELVVGGQSVWETAVELDPLWAYALMLGGPRAPHRDNSGLSAVQNTLDFAICSELPTNPCGGPGLPSVLPVMEPIDMDPDPVPDPVDFASPYDPDHWNWFKVQIRNPGTGGPDTPGPVSAAVWQQLRM